MQWKKKKRISIIILFLRSIFHIDIIKKVKIKTNIENPEKVSKMKIFSLLFTMLLISSGFNGLHEHSVIQGQEYVICGVLDIFVVDCENEIPPTLPPQVQNFLRDQFTVPAAEEYVAVISTCDNKQYYVRFCPSLFAYSGQLIRMRNPSSGSMSLCGREGCGIVTWSSIERISSCNDCICVPSSVKIKIDRGCGGYYEHGDRLVVSFEVISSASTAVVSIVDFTPDGKREYIIKNETFYTNRTYQLEGTVKCPGGKETLQIMADVLVNGIVVTLRDECSFYVGDCPSPCENVHCGTVCKGNELWQQECIDGECVDSYMVEKNSKQCGYDLCRNISCEPVCRESDLWSRKCIDGECYDHQVIEHNSKQCGYDPCRNHCTNGKKDCGEYGLDCGGGCPIIDSDRDGIEDCRDACPSSRCDRVDANGCEIDADHDGVADCEDDCPDEKGDPSNKGCPNDMNLIWILGCIGGVVAAGGLASWGIRNGGSPDQLGKMSRISRLRPRSSQEDMTAAKELYEMVTGGKARQMGVRKVSSRVAGEASKHMGSKVAEIAISAGTAATMARKQIYIHCSNCGEKLSLGSNFCSRCGNRIQSSDPSERDISYHKKTKITSNVMSKSQEKKNTKTSNSSEEDQERLLVGHLKELTRHERRKIFFTSLAKELSEVKEDKQEN